VVTRRVGVDGCWRGKKRVWGSVLLCWITLFCRKISKIPGGGFWILLMVTRFVGLISFLHLLTNCCLVVLITMSVINWCLRKCLFLLGDYFWTEFQQE